MSSPAPDETSLLSRLTLASLRRPWAFLSVALALTAASVFLASGLEVRSSFEELLPSDVPSVAEVKELIRRVGGDGTVLVSIESLDGKNGLPQAEKMAPVLADEILAMGPATIRAVESNLHTTEQYFETHWPLFVPTSDLQGALDELNKQIKEAKKNANPLGIDLGDDVKDAPPPPPKSDSPWLDPKQPMPRQRVQEKFARFHDGFMVHPDGTSLTLVVRPAGTSLGVGEARALLDKIQLILAKHQGELSAQHLRVGIGGTFPMFVAEYEAILHDVGSTALLCVSLILGSLLLFFRDLRSTVSLGVAVLVAVAMTFGITRLVIGYLNTQTAFLGSIVVGNGINYGLIYLARVRQLRLAGVPLEAACLRAAPTTAEATLLASMASSVSFGMLILAANRGFRHFGFIGGVGMLLCWGATFTLVPALLALFEKRWPVQAKPGAVVDGPVHVPGWMTSLFSRPGLIAGIFGVAAAISVVLFVREMPVVIERNLNNLTNELASGEETLVRDNKRGCDSLGKSVAGVLALLPSREDADKYCAVVRERMKEPRFAAVVDGCDTLSSVVPADQAAKLTLINQLRTKLSDTLIEHMPADSRDRLRSVRDDLAAQTEVTIADAPPALMDRFRERDGSIGRLASVTARPDAELELGPRLAAFVDAVRGVPIGDKKYDAAGEYVIISDLLVNIEHEGPLTTMGSLTGVCILVFLFLRRFRVSVAVAGSLIVGVMLMGGVGTLLHLRINFFNFIVFPITFGIAVDYGANVAVRVWDRGHVLEALAEVGPAVALCSWTSMIGYGSLLLALNKALKSFGWYAVIGEITTIVAGLVLLPALLILLGRAGRSRKTDAEHAASEAAAT